MSNLNGSSGSEGKLRSAVKPLVVPVAVWWLVFILGWGAMRAFWEFSYKYTFNGLETFPYYLSANWGDSLILTTICAVGYVEIRNSWKDLSLLVACVTGSLGLLIGALTQVQWNLEKDTVKNWTFNPEGGFNLPGWYHAFFLVAMCGVLAAMIGVLVHAGRNRRRWDRNSALRYITIGYLLVLFTSLLATDNMRRPGGAVLLSVREYIILWGRPLLACVLVVGFAYACHLGFRGIAVYAITLAVTAIYVPLLFIHRGLEPVSSLAAVSCVLAFMFGLFFITAPPSTTLIERLLRSVPSAVLAALVMVTVMATPERLSFLQLFVVAIVASVALILSSVPVCLYDGRIVEAFYTGVGSLFLILLTCAQVLAVQGGQLSDRVLSSVLPFGVICVSQVWVQANFMVVISNEKQARGADPDRYAEWSTRIRLLGAYAVFAIFVLITAAWFAVESIYPSNVSPFQMVACVANIVVMAVGSFFFSRLSYKNNVYVLRGVKVVPGAVYSGASASALASAGYGTVLYYYRVDAVGWGLLSLCYAAILCIACIVVLKAFGIPDPKDEWTFNPKVSHAILQDNVLSLGFLNVLCPGLFIWISARLSLSWGSFMLMTVIMLPMVALFLYFIKNNVEHLGREKRRICEIVDGFEPGSQDIRRGEDFLYSLEKHLCAQNRIAVLIVGASAHIIFAYLIIAALSNLGNAGEHGQLNRLFCFKLPTLPSIAGD